MTADGAETPPERAGKVRLVSMAQLDRRTKAAQIADATRSAIISDLGGAERLSTLERLQAENAAMSAAMLRDLQIRWIKGEEIPVVEMVSLENVFNRTAAPLGTTKRVTDVTPDIHAYLDVRKDSEE